MPIDLARLTDEQLEVAAVCLNDYAAWRKALAAQTAAAAEARRARLLWQALSAALRLGQNALAGLPNLETPDWTATPGLGGPAAARHWLAWFAEQARTVNQRIRCLTDEQARLNEAQAQKPPEAAAIENVASLSAAELEALNAQADVVQTWQAEKRVHAERLAQLAAEIGELGRAASALEVVCQTLHTMPAELLEALPATSGKALLEGEAVETVAST